MSARKEHGLKNRIGGASRRKSEVVYGELPSNMTVLATLAEANEAVVRARKTFEDKCFASEH
jgi:hypothetical protein